MSPTAWFVMGCVFGAMVALAIAESLRVYELERTIEARRQRNAQNLGRLLGGK